MTDDELMKSSKDLTLIAIVISSYRYFENVPSIVPLLEREHRGAAQKLDDTVAELSNLQEDRLKKRGRHFR